jgi:cyclopropane fatty-acyl-phospholipid synthase-like methyltransferase
MCAHPYDAFSKYYDIIYLQEIDYEKDVETIINIFNEFGISEGSRILDIGCGTGTHDILLAKKGFKVVGIDNNKNMVEKAVAKAKAEGVKVDFYVMDMRNMKLRGKFDAALSAFGSFDYLIKPDDVHSFFNSLRKHLKEGALFIADFMNEGGVKPSYKSWKLRTVGDLTLIRLDETSYNHETKILTTILHFYAISGNRLVDHQIEKHLFRVYNIEEFRNILSENGFELVRLLKPRTLEVPQTNEFQIRAIAKKLK